MTEKEPIALVEVFEGDRIVRAEQTEFLQEHEVWKPKENFVKVYDSGIDSILDNISDKDACKLSGMDCKLLLKLIRYISYESGMLTKTGKNDSRYALTNEDIGNMTGTRKQTVIKSMNNLVELSILSRNKYGRQYQYYANPYIFFRGKYINKMLKNMFKKYASIKNL